MTRSSFLLGAPLALFLASAGGCQKATETLEKLPPRIRVKTVHEAQVVRLFTLVGTVVPLEVSRVAASVAGKVREFPLRAGAVVTDKPLALLEEEMIRIQIKAAQAREKSAAAVKTLAKQRGERVRELVDKGNLNQEAVDQANSLLQQAEATYDAQAQEVELLKNRLDKHKIKPPFFGPMVYLVEKHTDKGEWVEEGGLVATLVQLSKVEVVVMVEEAYIGMLRVRDKVEVKFDALSAAKREGEIVHIVPRSNWEAGSRSFPVRVRIDNKIAPGGLPELKEGMLARVTLRGPSRKTLLVHKDAIVRSSGQPVVFKMIKKDEQTHVQPVEIREEIASGRFAIVEEKGADEKLSIEAYIVVGYPEGLAADDQIATDGAARLRAYQQVNVLEQP